MSYLNLVENNKEKLAEKNLLKLAWDLASILDNPFSQNSTNTLVTKERIKFFNLFCAVLFKAYIPLPDMEPIFWQVYIPKEKNDIEKRLSIMNMRDAILCRAFNSPTDKDVKSILSLLTVLSLFPNSNEYGNGITEDRILAMINYILVEKLNLAPLRPPISQIEIPIPITSIGPQQEKTFLIIDDGGMEIFSTARALLGIPNIKIKILHYSNNDHYLESDLDEWEKELEKTANEALALNPDAILMDQGLIAIKGSHLVKAIKDRTKSSIIFIANTGGDPKELYKFGCLPNLDKGRERASILRAIDMFNI